MKTYYFLVVSLLLHIGLNAQCQQGKGNWLTTDGNRLLDTDGNEVILAGVNWFGFETQISIPHGLYARDIEGMLQQTKDLGFNCLRIPWHNGMLREGAEVQEPNYWVQDPYSYDGTPETGPFSNLGLQGKTKPIEVMDYLIQWCQDNDMKVILDCHSRNADGYLAEKLWYTEDIVDPDTGQILTEATTEQQWIDDWVFITNRYKNYDAVIGMDINNEPNGKIDNAQGARWGNNDPATDWRLAAEACGNAILAANPNVLIIVEGIEAYTKPDGTQTSYWWGGNLQGARDYPVRLSDPTKLMYSPHEYGPTVYDQVWFSAPDFPDNMPGIWEEQFNFLNTNGTSPLLIGELGIKGKGGKDEQWFGKFIDFIKEKKLHFTFWALNPNSGDTGGILENDWSTVVQWKMDYLQPILSNPIPNCSGTLSVTEINDIDGMYIYPNPTKKVLNFRFDQGNFESIAIYDINGRQIDKIDSPALVSNVYTYNTSKLTTGLYIAKVVTKEQGQSGTMKIVKK